MPKFNIEWEFRTDCVVEAPSIEAARAAAKHHCDGLLQEWAETGTAENWETSVYQLGDKDENAPDMGVVKNGDGDWEAVNIQDARREEHNAAIKRLEWLRCPECGEEGDGEDFYRHVGDYQFAMLECPSCGITEKGPAPEVFESSATPPPDENTLSLFEEGS